MMPVVRISDATLKKLQPLAIPLEDSIDTLLNRLADAAHSGIPYELPVFTVPTAVAQQKTPTCWDVAPHDNLAYTRIISVDFNGISLPIKGREWNDLAKHIHEAAFQKLGSFNALRLATRAKVQQGKYQQRGFEYLPNIDVSLQGMDANAAWDNSARLAQAIGIPLSVECEWLNDPKAAKPGQKLQLAFNP